MPCTCDNWEFDGSDYGPAPNHCTAPDSPDHKRHQPRDRIGVNAHLTATDKDSSASLIKTRSSDKGSIPARLFSKTPTSAFESPDHPASDCHPNCHRKELTSFTSLHIQPTLDSEDCCKQHQHNSSTSNTLSTQSASHAHADPSPSGDDSSNATPALTTTIAAVRHATNDQRRTSSGISENNNNNNKEQQVISRKEMMQSSRDNSSLTSISDLSVDLPKAAVSPGIKTTSPSQPPTIHTTDGKQALAESKEGFRVGPNDMKREFLFNSNDNLNDKVSPQTASSSSSSRLYSLLHCAASKDNYDSSESGAFEYLRHKSKYYTNHYDVSPSSSSTSSAFPSLYKTRASDIIMKSSPELRSYFTHHTSPHFLVEENRVRTYSGSDAMPDLISSQNSRCRDAIDQRKSFVFIKSENASMKSPPLPDETTNSHTYSTSNLTPRHEKSWSPKWDNDTATTSSTHRCATTISTTHLRVKQEDALSPGLLHHTLSSSSSPSSASPYNNMSSSLSPWSDGGNDYTQHSGNTLGIPIKNKTKCASDSSLYLPCTMQPSLSPGLSSSSSASHESMLVECRWKSCSQTFTCQKSLAQHVNDYHVRIERPDVDFQCHWQGCSRQGKGFNARYKMLIHIRTHTNEKPHKCAVCRKCFSRLENLKIHMRSHTGEKPYACTFPGCTKAYSNSSDRFKHVRTHQEEKPYKCKMPGCHKQYTDPSSLRKHVRTHNHSTKCTQVPLRRTVSGDGEIRVQQSSDDKTDVTKENCHSRGEQAMETQDDFDKGLEMDADRQRIQGLERERSHNDMSDIQRKIELYSSLEMQSGIQKFGQIEDCVREDYHPTSYTSIVSSPKRRLDPEVKIRRASDSSNPPKMFDHHPRHHHHLLVPLHSRHPCFSVPSIITEDVGDFSKPHADRKMDGSDEDDSASTFGGCDVDRRTTGLKRKRSVDNEEEENKCSENDDRENVGEDLRMNVRVEKSEDFRQDKVEFPSLRIPSSVSSPQDKNAVSSSTSSSTSSTKSSPSPPRHWKKRKILDEQKQQEEEDEKKAKERQQEYHHHQSVEEAAKKNETSLSVSDPSIDKGVDMMPLLRHSPLSEINSDVSSHYLQRRLSLPSAHHRTANNNNNTFPVSPSQVLESLATRTTSMGSHVNNTSPHISPKSYPCPHPPNPLSHCPLSLSPPSPYSPSSYNPHSPNHLRHLPPPPSHPHPFLTTPLLYSHPELCYPSPKLDRNSISPLSSHTTPADSAAMFFPKFQKSYRDIYFPHLSTLMDLSLTPPGLESIPHHPHHSHYLHALPALTLTSTRHQHHVMEPVTDLCPGGLSLSPVTRTLL